MQLKLDKKNVVILGGGSGLGREVALLCSSLGAEVYIGGRTGRKLESVSEAAPDRIRWKTVDTGCIDSLESFFSEIECVDYLFNTTGDYITGPMMEISSSEAKSAFEAKFWGQYNAVRAAVPRMHDGSAIVLMSGADGARPTVATPAYVACNAALEGLGRGLAVELAPIRVNTLSPGAMDGNFWATRKSEAERSEAFERYSRLNTLKRVGTETEVAEAVVFLFANTYTSGTTLYVDGGLTLR